MLFLSELPQESVDFFIDVAQVEGFSVVDIEDALDSKVQDLEDTFFHLNLYYDGESEEITAMDNGNLGLKAMML
ncbi:MAG TPA: hypothetical protein VK135_05450 [Candidatus Dormibacteraeota bacterium]|nr:hypothetical protein [Candidatus Dormibacteraeota bacterium]